MKKLLSAILMTIAGVALVFGAAATTRAEDCFALGSYGGFNSKNSAIVYLLTITEAEEDPAVIYQRPRPKIEMYEPDENQKKIFSEEEIKMMKAKKIPFREYSDVPIPSIFVDGYWDGSGITLDKCAISETATGTFQTLSITEEAFPYPIAIVTYKHIQNKPQRKVLWKIFPIYSPDQLIPEKPEDLPDTANSLFGALGIEGPFGKGGVKLRYIDNKRIFSNEKELGYEETWRLPFQLSDAGSPAGDAPKKLGDNPHIFATGHTLKIINHGVYVLALAPEKKK